MILEFFDSVTYMGYDYDNKDDEVDYNNNNNENYNNGFDNNNFPGISRGLVKWISSLSLCSQTNRADNKTSDEINLHYGVPQETILDPLLFLIMSYKDNIPHTEI